MAVVVPGLAPIGVWSFELPLVEPQLLCRSVGGFWVEHAVVGDDALEAVGVAENPVGHVAAVAGSEGALAIFVDEGVGFFGVVEAEHEVGVGFAAPVSVDSVHEGLAVAGAAARVDHDDDVAVGGEELGVPAVAPGIAPRALRATVDQEFYGVFL